MAENKVFFIINKYSGTGFQDAIEGRIIDACSEWKLEGTIEYTKYKAHATELARLAVSSGFKRVFVMGGDGTVNEAAQGLLHTQAAMGILPKGSGNGLARHLRIPLKTPLALRLLGPHRVVAMDTISINEKTSVNVSGVGFDAHVASKFGKNGKRGLIGYGRLVLKEFLSFKEFPGDISIDGKMLHRKSFVIALANSSQFGNNARVAPLASVCDGLIDVCIIKKVPAAQAPAFAQKMFTGRMHRSAFVDILQAKNIHIRLEKPIPYHIDGEPFDATSEFNITIVPASLNVIIPDTRKSI